MGVVYGFTLVILRGSLSRASGVLFRHRVPPRRVQALPLLSSPAPFVTLSSSLFPSRSPGATWAACSLAPTITQNSEDAGDGDLHVRPPLLGCPRRSSCGGPGLLWSVARISFGTSSRAGGRRNPPSLPLHREADSALLSAPEQRRIPPGSAPLGGDEAPRGRPRRLVTPASP